MENTEEKKEAHTSQSLVDSAQVEEDRKKLEEQQARKQARIKAKRRKTRRIVLIFFLILIVIAGIIFAVVYTKKKNAEKETTVTVEVDSGEEVRYAVINSIVGNDVEVTYYGEADSDAESIPSVPAGGDASGDDTASEDTDRPDMGGAPSAPGDGEMPDMGSAPSAPGDGEMPDMGDAPSAPGDGEMPDMGSAPSAPGDGKMPDMGDQTSQTAGETISLEIPVGTDVYTKLGTVTTFSRLAAGDSVAMIFEEGTDNILRIYMQ